MTKEMTKEEAVSQMELLQLNLRRAQNEIADLLAQFCKKGVEGEHFFKKLWAPVDGGGLFRVVGYVCVLCRVRKPLEQKGDCCSICNELWDENYESPEDVIQCFHCGFNSFSNPAGLPFLKIPRGDEIFNPLGDP